MTPDAPAAIIPTPTLKTHHVVPMQLANRWSHHAGERHTGDCRREAFVVEVSGRTTRVVRTVGGERGQDDLVPLLFRFDDRLGRYHPTVTRCVSFEEVPAALTDLAARQTLGRVVVRIGE